MLIPLFFLAVAYVVLGSNALYNTLLQQSENSIEIGGERMQLLIDDYRHKAYEISNDSKIKEVVQQRKLQVAKFMNASFQS